MADADEALQVVDHVLAALRRADAHIPRRGHVSTKMARLHKKVRQASCIKMKMTRHVQRIVERYNADFAKTENDILNLELLSGCQPERPVGRPRRGPRRKSGSYKQWIPSALAKVCWGYRRQARKVTKRITKKTSFGHKKKPLSKMASPNVASAREWARHMRCSHGHVNRVRHAVAELFMRVQEDTFLKLPWVREQWVEIALDETQEPVQIHARGEHASVMVVHLRLFRLATMEVHAREREEAGSVARFHVVLPTVLLEGTTTDDLYTGLMSRLPFTLQRLSAKAGSTVILLNTDSFGSCLKLRKCLAAEVACLGCPCRMHQLCIALTATLAYSGCMSSLYCGSLLLRRARYQDLLRRRLRTYLEENLQIVYDAPSRQERIHAHAVWDLHFPLIVQGHEKQMMVRTKRAQAWQRLKCSLLPAGLKHFCPYGCHATKNAIIEEIYQDICELFLNSPPAIPAWNKWTKIAPVLCWFAPLLSLGTLFSGLAAPIFSVVQDGIEAGLDGGDASIKDEDTWKREEFARVKKFHRFLLAEKTPHKLVAVLLSMLPSLNILGKFFATATGGSETMWKAMDGVRAESGASDETMMLVLTQPSKSPVLQTIERLCDRLQDHQHVCWDALPLENVWGPDMCLLASVPVWVQIGQLHSRLVLPFEHWPWKLGRMLDADLEQQLHLAKEFLTLCPHRDPIIAFLRRGLRTTDDVLNPAFLEKVRRLLTVAPITNMVSEKSFARSHIRRRTNGGNEPKLPSLAAQHVLDESKSILDTSLARGRVDDIPLPARATCRTDAWNNFISAQRQQQFSMKDAADRWRQMSAREKATWQNKRPFDCNLLVDMQAKDNKSVDPVSVWPGCGDKDYPLRPESMKDVAEHIKGWAEAWTRRVGEFPLSASKAPTLQDQEVCKGLGCMQRLNSDTLASVDKKRKHLNRWAAMTKPKPPEPEQLWAPLPLFFIGSSGDEAASSDTTLEGVWLLQICPLHDGEVYCSKFVTRPPAVADVVTMLPSIQHLLSQQQVLDLWMAWEQRTKSALTCLQGTYAYRSMVEFQILELKSLFDMELQAARARKKDPNIQKVLHVTKGLSDEALAKEPRKRYRKKMAPAPADSEAAVVVDIDFDDWDEELEAAACPEAGHAEEVVELEVAHMMGIPTLDVDDMAEERSTHGATETLTSRPPRVVSSAASQNADADHGQEDVTLEQDAQGRVFRLDVSPQVCVGRVTQLRVGQPQEAFSVYCCLHGCQIMRRIHRIPSKEKILAWFQQGLHLPRGRDFALQTKHKDTFPDG